MQHLEDGKGSEGPRGIRVQIWASTKEPLGPDENWEAESQEIGGNLGGAGYWGAARSEIRGSRVWSYPYLLRRTRFLDGIWRRLRGRVLWGIGGKQCLVSKKGPG